jgi:membrane protein implicated in regulation of membrane protease activity
MTLDATEQLRTVAQRLIKVALIAFFVGLFVAVAGAIALHFNIPFVAESAFMVIAVCVLVGLSVVVIVFPVNVYLVFIRMRNAYRKSRTLGKKLDEQRRDEG